MIRWHYYTHSISSPPGTSRSVPLIFIYWLFPIIHNLSHSSYNNDTFILLVKDPVSPGHHTHLLNPSKKTQSLFTSRKYIFVNASFISIFQDVWGINLFSRPRRRARPKRGRSRTLLPHASEHEGWEQEGSKCIRSTRNSSYPSLFPLHWSHPQVLNVLIYWW